MNQEWLPSSELPESLGSCQLLVLATSTMHIWSFSQCNYDRFSIKSDMDIWEEKKIGSKFSIINLTLSIKKLHKCYMPGCNGPTEVFQTQDANFVMCSICHATGPEKPTRLEAEEAWGYN